MAYDTNSLNVLVPRVGEGAGGANAGEGVALWSYRSADANTVGGVGASDYFADAVDKGVKVGDVILSVDDNLNTVALLIVTALDPAVTTDIGNTPA